nr:beta carbonic anhydrase 5, chloroplastic isoform X2 [Tanacetum cinerariifolium]
MKVKESLNVTFDESPPPTKLSLLVDDDVGEEEAIENNIKVVNINNIEDESIEVDEVVNINESKSHPLEQVIGNLNQRTYHGNFMNVTTVDKLRYHFYEKFLACSIADSRVCASYILGFQPGEVFVVCNIANLVPPFENGPYETNDALEFLVNALQVENILVTGHSCCGGIRALMSMDDEDNSSSFILNWVMVGKAARSSTKATTSNLSFESINNSLLNLLSPFVSEDDEETRSYKSLFQNKTFFLGREVPWSNERLLENKELNAIIGA